MKNRREQIARMHTRQIGDATDMMQSESMQVVTRLTLSKDRDMPPASSMPKSACCTEGYNHLASFIHHYTSESQNVR